MNSPIRFTPDERALVKDTHFFQAKRVISEKIKQSLTNLHEALKEETARTPSIAPEGVDFEAGQFVKGEHLENFPYQYLDFPKLFSHAEKFTFRSLFWWGHHIVFAWILEGRYLDRYKENLLASYDRLAGRNLYILMAPTMWEWRNDPALLLEIRHDNRKVVADQLESRPWLKIHRMIDFEHPLFEDGALVEAGRETFRLMSPIIAPPSSLS